VDDSHLVARSDFGIGLADEFGEGVLSVTDERLGVVTDDDPTARVVEGGDEPTAAREAKRESAVDAVGDESLAVGQELSRAATAGSAYLDILVGRKEHLAGTAPELVVGDRAQRLDPAIPAVTPSSPSVSPPLSPSALSSILALPSVASAAGSLTSSTAWE
jgi:hypothetical protein